MLPVVSPSLYPHEQAVRSPVIHPQRENQTLFLCFFSSYAKQESCQAIVVWYSEGSWDLVTGSFLLAATSQQFPQSVKLTMMQGYSN